MCTVPDGRTYTIYWVYTVSAQVGQVDGIVLNCGNCILYIRWNNFKLLKKSLYTCYSALIFFVHCNTHIPFSYSLFIVCILSIMFLAQPFPLLNKVLL